MSEDDQDELLRILEAHGNQFLDSFASAVSIGKRKEVPATNGGSPKKRKLDEHSEEEWSGFGGTDADDGDITDNEEDREDDVPNPPRITARPSQPHVVVFSDNRSAGDSSTRQSKAQLKAFMSSKVSKITQEVQDSISDDEDGSDEEDELSNAQNDALLHRLVHTQILSGSLNPDLGLDSAKRKKALAGRVLEVAGKAKLGKGEKSVRTAERNKAAKFVREGIVKKQKERNQKTLEEAKHLGNYHPALKQLFDDEESQRPAKKREKGLKMGVGSFRGGTLRLSRDEIRSVEGVSRGGGGGRGGSSRGRGGSSRGRGGSSRGRGSSSRGGGGPRGRK